MLRARSAQRATGLPLDDRDESRRIDDELPGSSDEEKAAKNRSSKTDYIIKLLDADDRRGQSSESRTQALIQRSLSRETLAQTDGAWMSVVLSVSSVRR